MHFHSNDTTLNLFRHSFHFYKPEEGTYPVSGDRILELYYNYDSPAGWGSVGDEFIFWKDITEWLQGMANVEQGKTERFEKIFYYPNNTENYFLKLILETVDDMLRLQLSICDGLSCDCDDYINIDQLFSKEEWKTYSDEFRTWNEIFPFQLGDRVRTIKDLKNGREAGKVGIINEILVDDYLGYSVAYSVAHQEEGWNGLYWSGFVCDPDEIELIEKNRRND